MNGNVSVVPGLHDHARLCNVIHHIVVRLLHTCTYVFGVYEYVYGVCGVFY